MHQTIELIEALTATEEAEFAAFEAQIAEELTAHDASTQSEPERFCVYEEIRRALAARGVPPHEVAFIQEYRTRTARIELFRAMRSGDIRILLCSKQSTGMNIQTRLIALHHVDVPWRPGDLDQRSGRIERQGNVWPEFYEFAYPTEHSLDGLRWQAIETKSGFIHQMKQRKVTDRTIEDLSELTVSAAELKALASGNPQIVQRFALESELRKLESLRASWQDTNRQMRRRLQSIATEREQLARRAADLNTAHVSITSPEHEFKVALIKGVLASSETQVLTKRDLAGEHMLHLLEELGARASQKRERMRLTFGMYRGIYLRGTGYAGDAVTLELTTPDGITLGDVTTKTSSGIFQSADHVLRSLPSSISMLETMRERLAEEADKIQAMLDAPWDKQSAYEQVATQLDAIEHALLADTAEQITDTSVTEPAQPITRPGVFLPDPHDPAAMARACQQLAAQITHVSVATPPPEPATVPEHADDRLTLELPPRAIDLTHAPDQAVPLSDAELVPVTVPCCPNPHRPTFGQALTRSNRRKTPLPAQLPLATQQLDLFSRPASADKQATLWDVPPAS